MLDKCLLFAAFTWAGIKDFFMTITLCGHYVDRSRNLPILVRLHRSVLLWHLLAQQKHPVGRSISGRVPFHQSIPPIRKILLSHGFHKSTSILILTTHLYLPLWFYLVPFERDLVMVLPSRLYSWPIHEFSFDLTYFIACTHLDS